MTSNRAPRRRYRKTAERRVWVFSELNHDLTPEQMAKVLTSAALEQARLEHEARTGHEHLTDNAPADPAPTTGEATE
ncbi:hypothetical protein [Cryobacterium sp. GrIS_2_6]|uniref:hypothetical protein n=1 Tax=Cryobacterium sp. GrIS_2_6 TaxID=3162785 RepID=UPI002DF78DB5|nr:hypothetical protein [Cryobacterium psychrotolerans]